MKQPKITLTKTGYTDLLNEKKTIEKELKSIAKRLKEARADGDLRENTPYISAKQELQDSQVRLSEIENILQTATIADKDESSNTNKICQIGSNVTLEINGKQKDFTIVNSIEVNILESKISLDSPIGHAIKDKTEGETVKLKTETNESTIKIIKIS